MESEQIAMSVSEMAAALSISRPTAYQLLRRADFDAAFKCGTRTLISRSRLERWVNRQCGGDVDGDE